MVSDFGLIRICDADIDRTTGLLRKDALEYRLKQSVSHRLVGDGSFSIILFDVDYFKSINDLFSHAQGDSVLENIGEILKSLHSRINSFTGLYGRWGGE